MYNENDNDESNELDDNEGRETETMVLQSVSAKDRIDECLQQLADLKTSKGRASMSRSEILNRFSHDLCEYFGYIPELADLLLDLFSPSECYQYMEASDRPRPLVIRSNTLKTTRTALMDALTKRGSSVEAIPWSKVAIKVTDSTVPIGATPEYLAGHYMLQSAASMNPVMALSPQPGERVLDMSCAPGGKTSYMAQLMKNTGAILANDLKPQRQKATVANLHRLGVKNAIVCCYDGRKIPGVMKSFDRVLLDAPCSGLGVISRDPSVKLQRTVKDIQRIAHLQKELLCAAVDCADPKSPSRGIIVYSTCSISIEENEQVIDYILRKRYVQLIETGLEVGKPGITRYKDKRFHPSLSLTRRFYPHVHNMDGFYVAKLRKFQNGPRVDQDDEEDEEDEGEDLDMDDLGEVSGVDNTDWEGKNCDYVDNAKAVAGNGSKKATEGKKKELSNGNREKQVVIDNDSSDIHMPTNNKMKSQKRKHQTVEIGDRDIDSATENPEMASHSILANGELGDEHQLVVSKKLYGKKLKNAAVAEVQSIVAVKTTKSISNKLAQASVDSNGTQGSIKTLASNGQVRSTALAGDTSSATTVVTKTKTSSRLRPLRKSSR